MYNWNNLSDCYKNDWLLSSLEYNWTISSNSSSNYSAFYIFSTGNIDSTYSVASGYSVYPTVYLKSTIKITSGTGSSTAPFLLAE